jgi:hypothetical protein
MAKPCSNLKMPSISATEGCLDPGGSLKKKNHRLNLISACGRAFNNSSEGKKKKKKICGN